MGESSRRTGPAFRVAVAALAAATMLLLASCYDDHGGDGDAGSAAADARPASDAPICPRLAEYVTCGELCGGTIRCEGRAACGSHAGLDVCIPTNDPLDPRYQQTCELDFEGSAPLSRLDYCWGSELCASTPETDDDPSDRNYDGGCMSIDFCREAPGAGLDVQCIYSDGTVFVNGLRRRRAVRLRPIRAGRSAPGRAAPRDVPSRRSRFVRSMASRASASPRPEAWASARSTRARSRAHRVSRR
jgi:hypothetical protein